MKSLWQANLVGISGGKQFPGMYNSLRIAAYAYQFCEK
jgi:hypothetical protein